MRLSFAINKITKLTGAEHTTNEHGNILQWKTANGYLVSVYRNGDSDNVALLHVRNINDAPDSMSDYYPGIYPDSIPQLANFIR